MIGCRQQNATVSLCVPMRSQQFDVHAAGGWLCCQFGVGGDVKLFRSSPGTLSIDSQETSVDGELHVDDLRLGDVSIEQYVENIVKEILQKHNGSDSRSGNWEYSFFTFVCIFENPILVSVVVFCVYVCGDDV